MCGEPIAEPHQHVVNLDSRGADVHLPGCYLLFTAERRRSCATARCRSATCPSRTSGSVRRSGTRWRSRSAWRSSSATPSLDRTVAFYPGPAGATESELPLDAWDDGPGRNPGLATLRSDVEALLVRAPGAERAVAECLPRADRRLLRAGRAAAAVWRGFDGGQEAQGAHRRLLRDGRGARSPTAAGEGPAMSDLAFTVLDVAPSRTPPHRR